MRRVSKKPNSSGFISNDEAIAEKIEQLTKVTIGELSKTELAEIITQRRLIWLKENLEDLREKYKELPPEEQAFRIIFFEHMNINPKDLKVTRVSSNKIMIEGYNFCPYLETYKQLGLDTRTMCKEVNHDCFEKMAKEIHPNLLFHRNYENIRPYSEHCEEYIEFLE